MDADPPPQDVSLGVVSIGGALRRELQGPCVGIGQRNRDEPERPPVGGHLLELPDFLPRLVHGAVATLEPGDEQHRRRRLRRRRYHQRLNGSIARRQPDPPALRSAGRPRHTCTEERGSDRYRHPSAHTSLLSCHPRAAPRVRLTIAIVPGTQTRGYGRTRIVLMTGGVIGLLWPPSAPSVVGVDAIVSTTSMPFVTRAKMT